MSYNACGQAFAPIYGVALGVPQPYRLEVLLSSLTTAQLAANGLLTQASISSAVTLVDTARIRKVRMQIYVPTDQAPVTLGNTINIAANAPLVGINSQTFVAPPSGFSLLPGQSLILQNYNDPLYAVCVAGASSTIFYMNT